MFGVIPPSIVYILTFLGLLATLAGLGGFVVRYGFNHDPINAASVALYGLMIMGAAIPTFIMGRYLLKIDRRIFIFRTVFMLILGSVTVVSVNLTAGLFTPPWPARALHGLKPIYQSPDTNGEFYGGLNSWGQRDKERRLIPRPGIYRTAFLGDSFLEKPVAINLMVEDKLEKLPVEVLNLGVSGTAPDEYYYRLKNLARKFDIRHCYLFFYAGNDFIEQNTLKTFGGILSVYPKRSLFTMMGFDHLNYVLTRPWRPFSIGAANSARLQRMIEFKDSIKAFPDDTSLAGMLVNRVPEDQRYLLEEKMRDPRMKKFFHALRNPDGDYLRDYFVDAALRRAAGLDSSHQVPAGAEDSTFRWIRMTADLCRQRGMDFTLVVIPEAFQVDPRMRELYAPLTDMKAYFAPVHEATERLVERARQDRLDVIDLSEALKDRPGAYLNFDGHWSKEGSEFLAHKLSGEVLKRLPR